MRQAFVRGTFVRWTSGLHCPQANQLWVPCEHWEQMLGSSHPKQMLSWGFCPHRRKNKKQLLPSKCMTFLLHLGRKEREPFSPLPAREGSTGYWWRGKELFQGRACSPQGAAAAIPCPSPGCWDALACPSQAPPLLCSSDLCHFLSLERQRWGSRLSAAPEEQRVSIRVISL